MTWSLLFQAVTAGLAKYLDGLRNSLKLREKDTSARLAEQVRPPHVWLFVEQSTVS